MAKDQKALNLDPFQVSQVEAKVKETNDTVRVRIPEAYVWLLVPEQERGPDGKVDPQGKVVWQNQRLQPGPDALAVRASRKLKGEELLMTTMGGTRLRMELDRVPLWRGDHVSLRQLAEDFGRYLYLPRLRSHSVLRDAVEEGLNLTSWDRDTFALADSWDEAAGRYRAPRAGQLVRIDLEGDGLLVKPEIALRQMREEEAARAERPRDPTEADPHRYVDDPTHVPPAEAPPRTFQRFHGSVALDPTRSGRDAGRIAEEVLQHLTTLPGASVSVTLEIQAETPNGIPENTVRTVNENCQTLKFKDHGFEEA
jgi:hypothetical protein